MLVLSRKKDESIMIGDDVEIVVVDVRGDKVRLGITAPREIPVHRREIYDIIQKEKKQKQAEEEAKEQADKATLDQPQEHIQAQHENESVQEPQAEKAAQKLPIKKPRKQHQR